MISRGGSPRQCREQLDLFLSIQTTFPDRPLKCQGRAPIKLNLLPWCPEGLLVSCNNRDYIFIVRHKRKVDTSLTWISKKWTGVPL